MFNLRIKTIIICIVSAISIIGISSCKKQDDWLDVRRSINDVTPTTLSDLQAVLDGNNVLNQLYPIESLVGTDNIFVTDVNLNTSTQTERNMYIWAKDIFQGQSSDDWSTCYQKVEYANIALDGLTKINIDISNTSDYNRIKGSALFYRSLSFFNLAELFCRPYTTNANVDLGIPLRVNSDINIASTRSTLKETYDQIINDLKLSISLLPITPQFTTRPSQVSANALLAKVYLVMGDFANALIYSNAALNLNSSLLDYNSSLVVPSSTYRFPTFSTGNPEIIFYSYATGYKTLSALGSGVGNVDTVLYRSYTINDLRKTLYYIDKGSNNIKFQGPYTGTANNFSGIANDEVYLMRAECNARLGNTSAAMSDLNTLLLKRWKIGTFIPYTALTSTDALTQILNERRKEFPFTGIIRWEDLRRLNSDSRYSVTITHSYNGITYSLPPNDNRYVFPIPDQEVQIYGLQQNVR